MTESYMFTDEEIADIYAAALERKVTAVELIRRAVLDDLAA